MRNHFFNIIFSFLVFLSYSCNESAVESSNNNVIKISSINRDSLLYAKYIALPAPNDVYITLDTIFNQALKDRIIHTINNDSFFLVSISIRDSLIVDAEVWIDSDRKTSKNVERTLNGLKPKFSFITNYKYGSYSFLIEKIKLK